MIMKGISGTGSPRSRVVSMDIGSSSKLATQDHQILEKLKLAYTSIIPNWLFPSSFSDKNSFTSSRPGVVLVAPHLSAKTGTN